MKNNTLLRLTTTALLAAMCYIGFMFLRIDVPVPGGSTAFHLGNTFCILAALFLGGVPGGLAGAVGMSMADLFIPAYVTTAPKTMLLKFLIGFVCGFVAHRIGHIADRKQTPKHVFNWSLIACVCGMMVNVILEPIVTYFYKRFVLGLEADPAKILATWTAGTTFVNAIFAVIIATILYTALRPALDKSGILARMYTPKKIG